MSKIKILCPHCHEGFEMQTVSPPEPTRSGERAENGQITPLSSVALQDILETLQRIGPGKKVTTAGLYNTYGEVAADHLRKRRLTKYAFVLGLRRYGCEQWRSKYYRGYVTPDPTPTEPLKIDHKAKERLEAQQDRDALLEHRGTGVRVGLPGGRRLTPEEIAELPFRVE